MLEELLYILIAIVVSALAIPALGAVLAVITIGEFHDAE